MRCCESSSLTRWNIVSYTSRPLCGRRKRWRGGGEGASWPFPVFPLAFFFTPSYSSPPFRLPLTLDKTRTKNFFLSCLSHLWVGGPSIVMLIHKICMAFSGLGSFKNVEILISDIAAMLLNNIQQRRSWVTWRFHVNFSRHVYWLGDPPHN